MKVVYGDNRITISGTQLELKALWKCFRRNMKKGGEFWTPFEFPKFNPTRKYRISINRDFGCWVCWCNTFKPMGHNEAEKWDAFWKEKHRARIEKIFRENPEFTRAQRLKYHR